VVGVKVFDDRKGGPILLKERKDQTHGSLYLFIRVQHDLAGGIIDQANRKAKAQFSLFRFRQFAWKPSVAAANAVQPRSWCL
jgi:hypothetical protein